MTLDKTPINVLVTAVSGGSIGEQVCKSLLMGNNSYKLIVTNTSLSATKIIPADFTEVLPLASSTEYMDALMDLIDRYKVEFLIPGSEPELIFLSENLPSFSKTGVKILINSPKIIATCVDKGKTSDYLSSNGFSVPQSVILENPQDILKTSVEFPCIIKPALGGGGSAATFIAQDQEELSFFTKYLFNYGYKPLLQEYIPDAENEYTVGVLHNPEGKFIGSVTLKRNILSGVSNRLRIPNRTGKNEMGKILAVSSGISQGEIVNFEPVQKTAEEIAQKLGSTGPLNIQGRWNGSEFVTFEINPRFSGTTPMRALAGFNEPEQIINYWLGNNIDSIPRASLGKCIRGFTEYFIPNDGSNISSSI